MRDIKSMPEQIPGSKLNTELENPMPKRSLLQRLISESDSYEGVRGDPMLSQVRDKVAELDAANGEPSTPQVSASQQACMCWRRKMAYRTSTTLY
ncbi:hypothetical protein ACIGHF_15995 [Stenotrophomonas sp. NPDC077464]|uniref:hypothetical protein n=1 Tax=unclassified Stenotrophomonas TaxID=196198 RepID=UPI0037D59679